VPSTDSRRVLAAVVAVAVISGCGPTVSPLPTVHDETPTASRPPGTDQPSEPGSASATPAVVADPGHPYDASQILEAMRSSRRPGGVPDQLETDAIAAAVADQVWTFDGTPWAVMSIGGSCGPATCTLEIGGTPAGAVGEDLYVLDVTPSSGSVEVVEASLRGLSQDVVDRLDREARAAWHGSDLGGLALTSVGWQVPPNASEFVLSYRSGGEEGTPGIDLVLDVTSGTATER